MAPGQDGGDAFMQQVQAETALKGTVDALPPPLEPLLKFFTYQHLPERLQLASKPFCEVAEEVVRTWPRCPERTICLRKLLEAKDASVRCWL